MIDKYNYDEAYNKLTNIVDCILFNSKIKENNVKQELSKLCDCIGRLEKSDELSNVCQNLFEIIKNSTNDANAIYNNDPAADSLDEIMLCYPGFKAILYHRIAHEFYKINVKVFARYLSERIHSETGIDIHPGAVIGNGFAIDHGTGIVIGETTIIGNNVTLYQGVTLGAIHLENRQQVGEKRHPTIEDNVTIYANATILGGNTVIGKNSIIGASAFVVKSVPENSKIYNKN